MADPEVLAEDAKKYGAGATLLGFALIFGMAALLFFGVRAIYRMFQPPPSAVALSAYFVTSPPPGDAATAAEFAPTHLRIRGDVYQKGLAVQNGVVHIRVATTDRKFDQSVSTPLTNGHFQLEDPALNYVQPGLSVTITADAVTSSDTQTTSIQLNTDAPGTKMAIYASVAVLLLIINTWFVIAFTGRQTPGKNRAAIILSYAIIIIFLAVPIFAPVMLVREFPDAVTAMVGVPTGLVVTCTSSSEPKQHQWALNIGGYSFIPQPVPVSTPSPQAAPKVPAAANATDAPSTPATQPANSNPTPASSAPASTTAAPSAAASATTATSPAASSTGATSTAALNALGPALSSEPGDCRDFPPRSAGVPPSAAVSARAMPTGSGTQPPLVEVQGGLVVPLYVIILAVFGGAINMTRKVPGFQREDEASQDSGLGPASYLGTKVIDSVRSFIKQSPAASPAAAPATPPSITEMANQLDQQIVMLVTDQLRRRSDTSAASALLVQLVANMQDFYNRQDDKNPLPFKSYDDWLGSHPHLREALGGSWRVELLNQYMYLLSAPFLAVVTYYLLDLLGLSKPGVVVVLSFSVGLISEKIVSWILGVATGYLSPPSKA